MRASPSTATTTAEAHAVRTVTACLQYSRASMVVRDERFPDLLRAPTFREVEGSDPSQAFEDHRCEIRDLSAQPSVRLDLESMGFDAIDLSARQDLRKVLREAAASGELTHEQARRIRRGLAFRSFELSTGKRLRILYVAGEGLILRKAGPNGMPVIQGPPTEMNNHEGGTVVHADQDVLGTPVRQLLHGTAPYLFRHDSPYGSNRRSPFFLVNLWIPLQQITRPLCLMDRRTLDKRRHQLRYALPVHYFPNRPADRAINDVWWFLHDDTQDWYFSSEMGADSAYVFDTLGTPHGAFIAPGEDVAADRCRRLLEAAQAAADSDAARLRRSATFPASTLHPETTQALRRALTHMESVLREAADNAEAVCEAGVAWQKRALAAADSVVRKSLEMRCVALLTG